jgi:hypothetical protein
LFACYEIAVNLSKQVRTKGEYIATLSLTGGHGVVKLDVGNGKWPSHHNWWIPLGIDAAKYCTEIRKVRS